MTKDKEQRNNTVREMYLQGFTYAAIASKVGLSRQRVQQIVRPPAYIASLVRKRAKNSCESCKIQLRLGDGHIHHKERIVDFWKDGRFQLKDLSKLRYLCISCHKKEEEFGLGHGGLSRSFYVSLKAEEYEQLSALAKENNMLICRFARVAISDFLARQSKM